MNDKLDKRIIFRLVISLLGEVWQSLRGVTVGCDDSEIKLIFYCDGEITEDMRESASCVKTEILADLYPEMKVSYELVRVDVPNLLDCLDGWVYKRYE